MNFLGQLLQDRFRRYLLVGLTALGLLVWLRPAFAPKPAEPQGLVIHFFFLPSCPHCQAQKRFNPTLERAHPRVHIVAHDVSRPEELALLRQMAAGHGISETRLQVPATFIGDRVFVGFESPGTTGAAMERTIEAELSGHAGEQPATRKEAAPFTGRLTLPWIGEVNVLDHSLPVLAVVLGLVDGFNPCAMWVLAYLISLILSLNDRRKIWLLVGSFVLASAVLYFLFMTAWLNVFLIVGYLRPVTLLVGLAALGIGINDLKVYFTTRGALTCDISDADGRERTRGRIRSLVASPLTLTTVLGIIALAFVVNSIEFACSSAIPVVFTQVLALSHLSPLAHYGYILLYDLFFMADDLVIFGLAAFAVSTTCGERYAKHCKLIGGVVLLGLGVFLLFRS